VVTVLVQCAGVLEEAEEEGEVLGPRQDPGGVLGQSVANTFKAFIIND